MPEREVTNVDTCYLDVLDETGHAIKEVAVSGEVTIGRASKEQAPDVVIPPECGSASRQHAVLGFEDGRPMLTDCSRFGTIVNEEVIIGRTVALNDGDLIVFGRPQDGWRVMLRSSPGAGTKPRDAVELLVVSDVPRRICIGHVVVDEHLGDRAFRLLQILADNKGQWFPIDRLVLLLWPHPDDAPEMANQASAHHKKRINDLLRPYLGGHDAIESRPFQGYRMKQRLGG